MKVRCVATFPTEEGLAKLGPTFYPGQSFGVRRGREYVVLGMFFALGEKRVFGTGPWIQFRNYDDQFGQAPLVMFEITDHRLSRYWEAHLFENGVLSIAPPSFNRDFYMEDYCEGVLEIVEDFDRVSALIEAEASEFDH